jgi:hypothetical protein
MYFVFADDAKQERPSRRMMGPLVAAGAILVPGQRLRNLEIAVEKLCQNHGFPVDDPLKSEFKWSPGRHLWMRDNLVRERREKFFLDISKVLIAAEVKAVVVIEDKHCSVANLPDIGTAAPTHELDATYLLFERVNRLLGELNDEAVILNDRQGHSRIEEENKFLADALAMWRRGTRFVRFDRIAINLLCTQSRFVRLLQCADLVTSCVTAYVAGENVWSPRLFAALKPLLHSKDRRIGGYGVKFNYTRHRNLYHWLLGDSTYHAGGQIYSLPFTGSKDHPKPPELESWRIYLRLLEIVRERRPLIFSWLELSRPHSFSSGTFDLQLRNENSLACESLRRPANFKFVSEVLAEIAGIKIELRYSLVTHF